MRDDEQKGERDNGCDFCGGVGLVYPIVESEAGDGRSAEGIMYCPDCQGQTAAELQDTEALS